MANTEPFPEYEEFPEYNELLGGESSQGLNLLQEYHQAGGVEHGGTGDSAGSGTSAGSGSGSAFLKSRKKRMITQALAMTASATIVVTAVTAFPVGARTKVREVSTSSAVVATRFMSITGQQDDQVEYRLYDREENQLIEWGDATLTTSSLDFNSLEPGKSYRLQLLYEDKVIKSFVFNTLTEIQPTETEPAPPETRPPETTEEPMTEQPTESETERSTETESETESETEPETEPPETRPPETRPPETQPSKPNTPAPSLWKEGDGSFSDEIRVTLIQTGNYGDDAADGEGIVTTDGPNVMPQPEILTCSYGSAAYPFYPVLDQVSWTLPDWGADAKLYLEWSVVAADGGEGTEVHQSDFSQGALKISFAAADLKDVIGKNPRTLAFTPCCVFRGTLLKTRSQRLELPYLRPKLDFEAKERVTLEGLDSLEACGLTAAYDGITYEKWSGDAWIDAAEDFQSGHFDSDTDYRATYNHVVVTSQNHGGTTEVPDVSVTGHHI